MLCVGNGMSAIALLRQAHAGNSSLSIHNNAHSLDYCSVEVGRPRS